MAGRSYDQRFKSLCVLQILLKNTDNDNPLTIGGIVAELKTVYGIEANEHSIGRDIKELQRLYEADEDDELIERGSRFPYKIEYDGSGKRGYKVTKRPCRFSDLQLLVECIHSARFISKSEEARLLRMMNEFCSVEQSKVLKTEVNLLDRVKTNNNDIIRYIQVINGAIRNSHKIQFKYMKYTLKNRTEQTPRRNGTLYIVSPYKILINDGNFYLLAHDGKRITTYRIDRMKTVIETRESRDGAELYEKINMNDFTKRVFSMFGGEQKQVKIRFTNDMIDTVVDRFGAHGGMYIPDDERHFKLIVNVEISNMFYSWICGFRKKAVILDPPEVVDGFKNFLSDINQKYEN